MNNESSGGVWPPLIAFWQNRIHILTAKLIDSLSMDHSKQVVVCGDGVIEVCTAYFLAVKGVYIMLIEKFNVACTAFEKAGRFLALNWCNRGPLEELAHMSFNLHRSLFEELDVGFVVHSLWAYGLKAHSIVLEAREPGSITLHALFLSYYSSKRGKSLDPEVYPPHTGEVYICGMSKEKEVSDNREEIKGNPELIVMLKKVVKTVSSHLREGVACVKGE
ncbi:hypothetical protein JHK82_012446 [Glycine max]|nr:hypothetical protein JHK85_012799 [Glycine max]KAG5057470.1 hypothetical protein JHK86_012466 [Glycine max]KAG5154477.1 hypothetical protein JHK82_012446 [Glycine max]